MKLQTDPLNNIIAILQCSLTENFYLKVLGLYIHTDSKESSVSRAACTAFFHSKVGFNVAFSSLQSSPICPNMEKTFVR